MIKNVITQETLPQYLVAAKDHENNHIKLEELTEDELVENNLTNYRGRVFKIEGYVQPPSLRLTAHCYKQIELLKTNSDEQQTIIRFVQHPLSTTIGLSALKGASIIIDNFPTSPVGLESGTCYVSAGCLRMV